MPTAYTLLSGFGLVAWFLAHEVRFPDPAAGFGRLQGWLLWSNEE